MNRTQVTILQHRRERFHPFNTARIVHRSLDRCDLITAHNVDLADRVDSMTLSNKVGLLYPGDDAPLVTDLTPSERPDQLVILDGTWHQAKTLMRDIPRLRELPRYRLAPQSPGRYRIRREPNEHALSTLEATVAALTTIEPETRGFDRLLAVFDQMVNGQIQRSGLNWRQNQRRRRGVPNLPRALMGDLGNIVVANGEQQRGNKGERNRSRAYKPTPIFWTACRLVSGETFQCAIDSDSFQDSEFMAHLRITPDHVREAVSIDSFREKWKAFLRPDDHVAVYHQSTARLLDNIGADFSPSIILKSIDVDVPCEALSELRATSEPHSPLVTHSRASQRLADAIEWVTDLNSRYARR